MRTVTLIALLAGAAACSKKSSEPAPAAPGQGIELVATGAMPHQPLRYQLAKGAKTRVQLEVDFDATMPSVERIMPTMVMVMEIGADDVLPDGSTKVTTTVLRASARDRPNTSLSIETVNAQAMLMAGMTMTGTLSARGRMSDSRLASGGTDMPAQLADQLKDTIGKISDLAMPLPDPALGVGATWRYRKAITVEQIAMETTTEIEVTAIDGPRVSYISRIFVAGEPQRIELDDPSGAKVKLEVKNIRGSGGGKGVLDLAKMVGTGEQSSELAFDVTIAEHTGTAKLKTTTRMRPATEQDLTAAPGAGAAGSAGSTDAAGSAGTTSSAGSADAAAGSGSAAATADPTQDVHP